MGRASAGRRTFSAELCEGSGLGCVPEVLGPQIRAEWTGFGWPGEGRPFRFQSGTERQEDFPTILSLGWLGSGRARRVDPARSFGSAA